MKKVMEARTNTGDPHYRFRVLRPVLWTETGMESRLIPAHNERVGDGRETGRRAALSRGLRP